MLLSNLRFDSFEVLLVARNQDQIEAFAGEHLCVFWAQALGGPSHDRVALAVAGEEVSGGLGQILVHLSLSYILTNAPHSVEAGQQDRLAGKRGQLEYVLEHLQALEHLQVLELA